MKWDCDNKIEQIVKSTKHNVNNHIEMLYIQAVSKLSPKTKNDTKKEINEKLIESYLEKRGYTINYILGKRIMIKAFTCVLNNGDYIEIWHDKTNNNKSIFINESFLTGLPITLDYMERI